MKVPYCDCINYDMNGNPNCSIHKGKLQEFYPMRKILYYKTTTKTQIIESKINHIDDVDYPYCDRRVTQQTEFLFREGYITCKPCIRKEFKERQREMIKMIRRGKRKKGGFYYNMKELKAIKFPPGGIKDLK